MENRWVPALAPWRSDTGDSSRPSQSSGTRGRHRVDAGPSGAASPGVLEKTSFPPLPARVPEKPGAVRPSVPPRTPASPPQPRDRRACWAHDGCCRAMRRPGWDVSSPCPASFSVPHAALPRLSVPPPGNKGCGGCCGRLQACSVASQGLVSSRHRLVMCQLAVQNSDWIRVDPWECYQDTWQTTCSVLQHHRDLMKRVTGCILSNVSTPSMTPVIGQPQQETPQPAYQNSNVPAKPTAAKILGKVGESLSRICCVRPPVERFTFVDENANLGTVMRYEEIELRILLLCGSDLLESFCIPGLWNEADVSSMAAAGAGLGWAGRRDVGSKAVAGLGWAGRRGGLSGFPPLACLPRTSPPVPRVMGTHEPAASSAVDGALLPLLCLPLGSPGWARCCGAGDGTPLLCGDCCAWCPLILSEEVAHTTGPSRGKGVGGQRWKVKGLGVTWDGRALGSSSASSIARSDREVSPASPHVPLHTAGPACCPSAAAMQPWAVVSGSALSAVSPARSTLGLRALESAVSAGVLSCRTLQARPGVHGVTVTGPL
uniref:Uncharacterized protein n=1 Tax=Oryctolagus cuniculus TaxID=9986 RepID=A0A5F9D9B6_RABIT